MEWKGNLHQLHICYTLAIHPPFESQLYLLKSWNSRTSVDINQKATNKLIPKPQHLLLFRCKLSILCFLKVFEVLCHLWQITEDQDLFSNAEKFKCTIICKMKV